MPVSTQERPVLHIVGADDADRAVVAERRRRLSVTDMSPVTERLYRFGAAALVLVTGLVHLDLYLTDSYDRIPDIGVLFLANVVTGVVLAAGLVIWPRSVTVAAGLLFSVGTLVAYVLSRTGGILGYREIDWRPEAYVAVGVEVVAAVLLLQILLARLIRSRR
ncbi:hypothetical protein BH20ACT2_BH20ACT2_25090 [soil metagenome]